ncbi:MAG: hypothetical protein Q9226_007205 [Calogaya cf. arnoldii]
MARMKQVSRRVPKSDRSKRPKTKPPKVEEPNLSGSKPLKVEEPKRPESKPMKVEEHKLAKPKTVKVEGPTSPESKPLKVEKPNLSGSKAPKVENASLPGSKPPKIEEPSPPDGKPSKVSNPDPIVPKPNPSTSQPPTPAKNSTSTKASNDFSSLLSGGLLTFYIGPKTKEYQIHRNLLCHSSLYFRDHFSHSTHFALSTLAGSLEMYLPDHDPMLFELLQSFLYRGFFAPLTRPAQPRSQGKEELQAMRAVDGNNIERLVKLCLMAHEWQLRELKNSCIDHLKKYMSPLPSILGASQIAIIYSKTQTPETDDASRQEVDASTEADPLRRYIIDQFIFRLTRKSMAKSERYMHIRNRIDVGDGEFTCDVFEKMAEGKKYVDPELKGRCEYHAHGVGEWCAG